MQTGSRQENGGVSMYHHCSIIIVHSRILVGVGEAQVPVCNDTCNCAEYSTKVPPTHLHKPIQSR